MKQFPIILICLIVIDKYSLAAEIARPPVKLADFICECMSQELADKSYYLQHSLLEKPSSQQMQEHWDYLNQVQNDKVVAFIKTHSSDVNSLLDNWFQDIKEILPKNSFPQRDFFIEYWSNTLRNELDILQNGNKLRGYLDNLLEVEKHPSLVRLGVEIQSILAEWELEKKNEAMSFEANEEPLEEVSKRYQLVFKKPISVKGSHEKYLFRDNSGHLFKVVIVRPHGNKVEKPKQEQETKISRQIENNLERKADYASEQKVEPTERQKKEKATKEFSRKKRLLLQGDLAARLHKYEITIDFDKVSICNKKDKENKIEYGNEYLWRFPENVKNLVITSFKKLSLNKENIRWLDDGFENGLALFCYFVVNLQEQKLKSEQLTLKSSTKALVSATVPVVDSSLLPIDNTQAKQTKAKNKIKSTVLEPVTKIEVRVKPISDAEKGEFSEKLFNLIRDNAKIEEIEQFLDEHPTLNINYVDFQNNSAVLMSVKYENLALLKSLINRFKKKIKLNIADDKKYTPVLWAASKKRIDILKILVAGGAGLNDTLPDGTTALILAAQNEDLEMVEFILKHCNKILVNHQLKSNADDLEGMSALMFAADLGHLGMAIALLKAGANLESKNCYNETALIRAIMHGRLAMVQYLLGKKARVDFIDSEGRSPLVNASHLRFEAPEEPAYEIMQSLLAAGASPNYRSLYNNTPSFFEISDDLALLKLFLKSGADPTLLSKRGSVLTRICNSKYLGEMSFQSFTILSDHIVVDDKIDVINEKLKSDSVVKNKFIEMVSDYDEQKLDIKIEYGNYLDRYFRALNERIKILLQHGGDPNARKTKDNSTPIHYQAYAGNIEGVKILLQFKANPHLEDNNVGTAADFSKRGRMRLNENYKEYLERMNDEKQEYPELAEKIDQELALAAKRYKKFLKNYDAIDKLLP